jgi:nitric oxide reductase NorD protein
VAEPEDLILEGAHFATRLARDVWRRYGPPAQDRSIPLARVRVRLETFVTALFRADITIAAMEPPAPLTWLSRAARGRSYDARDEALLSGTDGRRVYVPAALQTTIGEEDTVGVYRLLAVEQAARLVRGTLRAFMRIEKSETRDWFLLAEAATIDRWIALEVPGLAPALKTARAHAIARRRAPASAHVIERQVRALLAADPLRPPPGLPDDASPEGSLAWAQVQAEREAVNGRYLEAAPAWYWGRLLVASEPIRQVARHDSDAEGQSGQKRQPRVAEMRRRPRVREASEDEDDQNSGAWVIRPDEPQESVEDPYGLQRPTDRAEDADPEGLADSLSELPEARIVRTPGQVREVLRGAEEFERAERDALARPRNGGTAYPEWDHRLNAYRNPGAILREPRAPLGDAAWVAGAMARQGRLVRRVRARFERLRPRHVRLDRQPDGSEPDIAAWVTTVADVRAGATVDGRLYVERRRARRELAVALLADVSASTDGWVSCNQRIVDVEKDALLVVCEALDALGDRYGIFAFSGEGAEDVSVLSLKTFGEEMSLAVRRRIAALDADRFTRMGAPVRHVTSALCREHASRRLLLILSDGKPNDVDVYEGRYGVEDTRQAVAEARRLGVTVFCLTVDREAPRYAGRVFGRGGFAMLHRAEQLPALLIEVLRQLIRF